MNPELYGKVYGDDVEATDDEGIVDIVPETEADVQRLLSDFAGMF